MAKKAGKGKRTKAAKTSRLAKSTKAASIKTKKVKKLPAKGAKGKKAEFEKRMRISQRFAAKLIEKFKRTVKAVVVYGSTARGAATPKSDLDIFVILDDTKVEKEIPSEIKDKIWNELLNIAGDVDKKISCQAFMFLTEFWESLRTAEPVTLAILRYGIPVFDVGVFMPAKRMLQRGNIPTTKEAVDKKIYSAPQLLEYAQSRVKSAAHYMEQAVANAGNAALMFIGRVPQNKEDVPANLDEYFVKAELLEKKFVDDVAAIIKFAKDIEHEKEIQNIGAETDKYLKLTDDFIKRMQLLLKELEFRKKRNMLMKTYETFLKANVGALRYVGVKPPEELKDLPKTIHQNFPELKELHTDIFSGVTTALTMMKEGKAVPEREIYDLREKTRAFVIQLGQKLKELKEAGKIKPLPEEKKGEGKKEKRAEKKGEAEKLVEEEMPSVPPMGLDLMPENHVIEKLEKSGEKVPEKYKKKNEGK